MEVPQNLETNSYDIGFLIRNTQKTSAVKENVFHHKGKCFFFAALNRISEFSFATSLNVIAHQKRSLLLLMMKTTTFRSV